MSEDQVRENSDAIDDLYSLYERLQEQINKLNAKFFSVGEKGPTLKVVEEVIKKGDGRKYNISGKPCRMCGGLISWDDYDTKNRTGRPVHVDEDGYKVGDGSCPAWRDEE